MKTDKSTIVLYIILVTMILIGSSLGYHYYNDIVRSIGSWFRSPALLHISLFIVFTSIMILGFKSVISFEKSKPIAPIKIIATIPIALCLGFSFAMAHRLFFASIVDIVLVI